MGAGGRKGLTQSLLERLDISPLGSALAALLIVRARMPKTRTCAAAGTNAVALELALPANHAGQALGLWDARVVGNGGIARHHVVVVGRAVGLLAGPVAGRSMIRRAGHGGKSNVLNRVKGGLMEFGDRGGGRERRMGGRMDGSGGGQAGSGRAHRGADSCGWRNRGRLDGMYGDVSQRSATQLGSIRFGSCNRPGGSWL
jgi:hypothetical protein